MLILLLSQLLPLTLHRQNQTMQKKMQNIGEICCFFQGGQKVDCFVGRV
jgi:hypothetical protein